MSDLYVRLQGHGFSAQVRVDRLYRARANVEFSIRDNRQDFGLMADVQAAVYGREIERIEVEWPADWREAFKARWWRARVLRRWRVRKQRRTLTASAFYPEITDERRDWTVVLRRTNGQDSVAVWSKVEGVL